MKKSTLLLLLLPLTACSEALAPRASACNSLSDLTDGLASQNIPRETLRSALVHAAGPMASTLPNTANSVEFRLAATTLATNVGNLQREQVCQYLRNAANALNSLPDDPATRPDRAGIRLILGLTAQSVESLVTD